MTEDLISLCVIALIAAACPVIAKIFPKKIMPETVLLLLAGALLGPHMANIVHLTASVDLLSELGLAFLFLLAGFEINPKNLTNSQGKRGFITWILSFGLAFIAVRLSPGFSVSHIDGIAVAIALTTTALGALIPIMKERGFMGTSFGNSILAYGTWGELCPVLAMALLLSTRAEWQTILILALFIVVAVTAAVIPAKAKRAGHWLYNFMSENANTTSQTMMRITVLLLISLVTYSAVFELDIVLGAFAAGFVLRYIISDDNHTLETKLEGVGYGFLIPVFFVVSGANIDLYAVTAQPGLLAAFIVMLLVIRMLPIFISLSIHSETRAESPHNRMSIALYCTTALPLIVAVTSVATKAGTMTQETAGILVAAGAVTVFLMPLLASIFNRLADSRN